MHSLVDEESLPKFDDDKDPIARKATVENEESSTGKTNGIVNTRSMYSECLPCSSNHT